MPGEFEPHAGCWMLWPERPDNWRLGAKPAQAAYAAVAQAIARFERVTVGVSPAQFANARRMLPPEVRVVEMSSNDAWMRDCGATFVVPPPPPRPSPIGRSPMGEGERPVGKSPMGEGECPVGRAPMGEVRGVQWRFNAWGGLEGGLYFPWDQDARVAQKMLEIEWLDRYQAPLVLEGGSIHVDGEGTCLTTAECLLNPNRNPGLSQAQIEAYLCEYLNVEKVIWLSRGVIHDETSGHVDNLCCFARPGVIALTWCDDRTDPQYDISHAAYEQLASVADARGRRFAIHKIHQPGPLFLTTEEAGGVDVVEGSFPRTAGSRLAASYVNFYIANRGVIVPLFGDRYDEAALRDLRELFPEREVVGVAAREILLGGGNIHCITQQQPGN